MTQFGFYFDGQSCTGCKTCQVACKEIHGLGNGLMLRRVYDYQGGSWKQTALGHYVPKDVFGYKVSIACNHCDNPACVETCPTGAMQKDAETGIVWTDHVVCIGCGSCAEACPYDAPAVDEEAGYSIKCDTCYGDRQLGRKAACVAACPMRALDFGPIDELRERYGEGDVEIEPLPQATTAPNLVLAPHALAQKSGAGTGAVVNLSEELA